MESKVVLNQRTKNIVVTRTPSGTSNLDVQTNGTLTIVGGIPAYINSFIKKHNLDNHAHPNLWYIHEQGVASAVWHIEHNLDRYPSVTIVDSAENVVVGYITYIDKNNVEVNFNGAFKGKAYLN